MCSGMRILPPCTVATAGTIKISPERVALHGMSFRILLWLGRCGEIVIAEQGARMWHRLLENEMVFRNGRRAGEKRSFDSHSWHADSRYTKVAATFLPAAFGVSI